MKVAIIAAAAAALATTALSSAATAQTPGSWTGFYVGGYAGGAFSSGKSTETVEFDKNLDGGFGDSVLTSTGANAFSPGFCGGAAQGPTPATGCKGDKDGFAYGVHGGYDWQMPGTPFVVGVVGDIGKSNVSDSASAFSTTPAYYTLQRREDYNAAISARGGRLFFGERTLVYGTAGVAYSRVKNSFSTSNTANRFTNTGNEGAYGYKLGAGVEHKLTRHISVGVEYAYTSVDADKYRVRASNAGATAATNPFLIANTAGTDFRRGASDFANHHLTASLNYRF